MKSQLIIALVGLALMNHACQAGKDGTGLADGFNHSDGWAEVNPEGDTILPALKMESKDGALVIHHKFRTLEQAHKRHAWVESEIDYSTNLRKNYGLLDLDKYHYVVLNVKEKGSSSYFDINGYTTKLGYTTGITVIDLHDYDDPRIKGLQRVDFGIDLQDNHTFLVLEDLKFVSKLSSEEKEKLIGSGLTIRDENLEPRPYHGLEALKLRENLVLPVIEGEEMAIFRDDATGAITTRLTATLGDDYFGEGGIWSANGKALKFKSSRKMRGIPVCLPGEGKVIAGPENAGWRMWSNEDPDILYVMKKEGLKFSVYAWNSGSGEEDFIAGFEVPEIGSYVEFKRFTPLGNIVVAFRETPHLYLIDVHNKNAKYIHLPTRLKDASILGDDQIVRWANCYTYELRWKNLETGEEGAVPSFSAGHASWGSNGMVANFGGHLNVFISGKVGMTFTPGELISVWANWKNDIVTDYGTLTDDNLFVFTNGTRHDVKNQHLMISSADPGSVMRVARYFTKFSWTSTTYSRPSPDYTKLIYNENVIGNTELFMAYTRRPDFPVGVHITDELLTWDSPERMQEISGYNIYASMQSGRDFVRINDTPVEDLSYAIDHSWKYYAVTSLEHSGLESTLSQEVSNQGSRTFYFEAEEMEMHPPARRFFDGYCNNFQCVRINAESEVEKSSEGEVRIPLNEVPAGQYNLWARVKGNGTWSVQSNSLPISAPDWQWVQFEPVHIGAKDDFLLLSSEDDALKLDMLMLTMEDFIPEAPSPADGVAPGQVMDLSVKSDANKVHISWAPVEDLDLHHYSVYCGKNEDFECNNETLVRSVLKTSVTDIVPDNSIGLYYKVVAVDNRWNESVPASVQIR